MFPSTLTTPLRSFLGGSTATPKVRLPASSRSRLFQPPHRLKNLFRPSFKEDEHPRGQPENAGEFAPAGEHTQSTSKSEPASGVGSGSGGPATDAKGDGEKKSSAPPLAKKLLAGVLGGQSLTGEQKKEYTQAVVNVVKRMPPNALADADAGTREVEFFHNTDAVKEGILNAAPSPKVKSAWKRQLKGEVGGCYMHNSRDPGKLYLDGAATWFGKINRAGEPLKMDTVEGIYAHELTHAIDGPGHSISRTQEWSSAWKREIKFSRVAGAIPLTEYARTSAIEGLAEFGHILYGSDVSLEDIEKKFPMCSKIFQDRGLWANPRQVESKQTDIPEIFDESIPLDNKGSHADTLLDERERSAPKSTGPKRQGRLFYAPEVVEKAFDVLQPRHAGGQWWNAESNPAPFGYCPECREPASKAKTCADCGEFERPKFASTQVNVPEPVLGKVRDLGWRISPEDVDWNEGGIFEDDPHVTARYGLHSDKPEQVAEAVAGFGPVFVHLGKLNAFYGGPVYGDEGNKGKEYDVLYVEVMSPDMVRLNEKLAELPHTQTYANYHPHMTVAYLKAGRAKKYVDSLPALDDVFVVGTMDFSTAKREKTEIPLAGGELAFKGFAPDDGNSALSGYWRQKVFNPALHPHAPPGEGGGQFIENWNAGAPAQEHLQSLPDHPAKAPAPEAKSAAAKPKAPHVGRNTAISLPDREGAPTPDIPARYEVRELGDLKPSHNVMDKHGRTFRENADYPQSLQPRDYTNDRSEQDKVRANAQNWKPHKYNSTAAEATAGPSTVSNEGIGINGNSRLMSLQQIAHDPAKFAAYKNHLIETAAHFGIDPEHVKGMNLPTLVRVVDIAAHSPEAAAFASAGQGNEAKQQSPLRTANNLTRMISADMISGMKLEGDTTLSEAVAGPEGKSFRDSLFKQVPTNERNAIFQPTKSDEHALTDQGKALVRNMFVLKSGVPVHVAEKLEKSFPKAMDTIEAAVPQLMKLQRDHPESNVVPQLVEAMNGWMKDSKTMAMRSPEDIEKQMQQTDIDGNPSLNLSPGAHMMLEHMLTNDNWKSKNSLKKGLAPLLEAEQAVDPNSIFADAEPEANMSPGERIAEKLGVQHREGARFGKQKEGVPEGAGGVGFEGKKPAFRSATNAKRDEAGNVAPGSVNRGGFTPESEELVNGGVSVPAGENEPLAKTSPLAPNPKSRAGSKEELAAAQSAFDSEPDEPGAAAVATPESASIAKAVAGGEALAGKRALVPAINNAAPVDGSRTPNAEGVGLVGNAPETAPRAANQGGVPIGDAFAPPSGTLPPAPSISRMPRPVAGTGPGGAMAPRPSGTLPQVDTPPARGSVFGTGKTLPDAGHTIHYQDRFGKPMSMPGHDDEQTSKDMATMLFGKKGGNVHHEVTGQNGRIVHSTDKTRIGKHRGPNGELVSPPSAAPPTSVASEPQSVTDVITGGVGPPPAGADQTPSGIHDPKLAADRAAVAKLAAQQANQADPFAHVKPGSGAGGVPEFSNREVTDGEVENFDDMNFDDVIDNGADADLDQPLPNPQQPNQQPIPGPQPVGRPTGKTWEEGGAYPTPAPSPTQPSPLPTQPMPVGKPIPVGRPIPTGNPVPVGNPLPPPTGSKLKPMPRLPVGRGFGSRSPRLVGGGFGPGSRGGLVHPKTGYATGPGSRGGLPQSGAMPKGPHSSVGSALGGQSHKATAHPNAKSPGGVGGGTAPAPSMPHAGATSHPALSIPHGGGGTASAAQSPAAAASAHAPLAQLLAGRGGTASAPALASGGGSGFAPAQLPNLGSDHEAFRRQADAALQRLLAEEGAKAQQQHEQAAARGLGIGSGRRKGFLPVAPHRIKNLFAGHDVSDEPRDDHGEWTTGGGSNSGPDDLFKPYKGKSKPKGLFDDAEPDAPSPESAPETEKPEPKPHAPQVSAPAKPTSDNPNVAAIEAIKPGSSAFVLGYKVHAKPDGNFRVETKNSHVTGTPGDILWHIHDQEHRASPEKGMRDRAMARADAESEADFFDTQANARTQAGRAKVPNGARAVSLDPETRGRLGTVRKAEGGETRLELDNSPDLSPSDFEPLDSKFSWRGGVGGTVSVPSAKVKPKQGRLDFGNLKAFLLAAPHRLKAGNWDESKHPRGQPENAGEFGPGGGHSDESEFEPSAEHTQSLPKSDADTAFETDAPVEPANDIGKMLASDPGIQAKMKAFRDGLGGLHAPKSQGDELRALVKECSAKYRDSYHSGDPARAGERAELLQQWDTSVGLLRSHIKEAAMAAAKARAILPSIFAPENKPEFKSAGIEKFKEPIQAAIAESNEFVASLTNWPDGAPSPAYNLKKLGKDGRAYFLEDAHRLYSPRRRKIEESKGATDRIALSSATNKKSAVHELGHLIETRKPGASEAATAFLKYRTAGETPKVFAEAVPEFGFGEEKGCPDDFAKGFGGDEAAAMYVGRIYDHGATELVSMGVERLHDNPYEFYAGDPEYFAFMLHVLGS